MTDIYATPEAELTFETDSAVYASFGSRLVASLIDGVLILLLTFPLLYLFYGKSFFESETAATGTAGIIIQYILPLVITMIFWRSKGATPGKMIMKLKIVDAESMEPASTGRLVLRYVGYYVSSIVLGLGFFWVIWDKKKQGWHDKMGKTVVIKSK